MRQRGPRHWAMWAALALVTCWAGSASAGLLPADLLGGLPRHTHDAAFAPPLGGEHMYCAMPPRRGDLVTPNAIAIARQIRAQQMSVLRAAGTRAQLGTKRALVLLIDFSDQVGTYTAQHYRDMLFTPGQPYPGSMHDFYDRASHGQIDIGGEVVTSGTSDWFRSSQTRAALEAAEIVDRPGTEWGLLTEVINAADPFVDYSEYDLDGNGVIDNLIFVYAGPNGAWSTLFWPHAWSANIPTADGVRVGGYQFTQDAAGMGVYAHEMGHNLGLPDLYDYDSGAEASAGVGGYCLMAGSGWDDPTVPSAWCRVTFGWCTPTNVTAPLTGVIIPPGDQGGTPDQDQVYRLWRRGAGGSEYFLIENKQQSLLPSRGLLVWHCDDSVTTSNDKQWYPGLPGNEHYLVALEQADGNWDLEHNRNGGDANDAYPLANATSFGAATTPSSRDYFDVDTEVTLRNIARQGTDILVDMASSNAGPPAQIDITQQPTDTAATQVIAPPITVRLLDDTGRLVDWATQNVTVAIGNNPGSATLGGTTTVAAVEGVATFNNLTMDKSAADYTLVFSSAGCADATSDSFDILPGSPTTLAIVGQPSDVAAGSPIAPAVEVQLYDAGGNPALLDSSTVVTLALQAASNTTGATLSGTTNVAAQAGLARFANVMLDKVGLNYRLTATIGGAAPVASDAFDVTPGPAAALAMVTSPEDGTAGVALSPAPAVQVTDAFGNFIVGATNSVSATLEVPSGTPPTLGGTVTHAASVGIATFGDLLVNLVGSGYTLRFTAPGLADAVSEPFDIGPGPAAALAWVQAPSATQALATLAPMPTLELLDAYGNRATSDNATTVDVALGANPTGATLTGALSQPSSAGIVTYGDLAVNRVGAGYTLVASGAGLAAVESAPFDILERTPDPSKCTVTLSPAVIGTDGQEATLHIVLRDSAGLPVQGNLPDTRALVSEPATGLTLSDAGTVSDDDGVCEVRLTASTTGGYAVAPRFGAVTLGSVPLDVQSVFSQDFPAGLYCLGLPLYMTDSRPTTVLGAAGWRMARYDAAGNQFVQFLDTDNDDPRFSFTRARGQWVRFLGPTTLRALGELTPAQPFDAVLGEGWNCLANPFNGIMPWNLDNLQVLMGNDYVPLSNPTTWDTVSPYAWHWDGTRNRLVFDPALPAFSSSLGSVPRAGGIWVWCARAGVTLRMAPPTPGASRAARSVTTRDWALALTATGPDGVGATVTTGVSASLARGLRLAEPPRPVGAAGVGLAVLDDASRLAGDIRAWSAGAQSWDLLLTSPAPGSVSLTWPSLLRSLPGGLTAELTDQQTGRAVLLNTQSAYRFEAARAGEQRRLRLTVRPGHVQRSAITSLALVGGRAAGAAVAISLTGPAEVLLRVKGLGGRVVKETSTSAAEAGTVQVAWDGTDRDGRPVPAGTYQLEATAVAPNGAVSRAVRAITVR